MNDKRLNYLKYLFDFPKEFNINKDNINYIYFKIPEWCCLYTPTAMFKDIKPFGWNKVRQELINVYDSKNQENAKFYLDIMEYPEKTIKVDLNNYEQNELILNYIKCRPNIKILTQFSDKKLNFKNCNLYATKEIELSNNAIEVLIYEMFCLTPKFKEYKEINEYVKLLKTNKVKIYVYEHETEDIKTYYDIDMTCDFVTPDFITAINMAEIYFNLNSLKHINEMLLERFLNNDFNRSRLLLNTLKKMLLVRKLTLLEQSKYMLFSGLTLATYGIRKGSDLDIIISNLPESIDNNTMDKLTDIFFKQNSKLFFIDAFHPKYEWPKHSNEWHKIWASHFGAKNILECIHNPKYHYYFCGVKIMIFEADIIKRQIREKPAAVADLLMINRLLHKNIKLNPIRKNYINLTNDNIIVNPIKFIKTVQFRLKKKYNTTITKDEEKSIIFI